MRLFRLVTMSMRSCSRWSCWHARPPNTITTASRPKTGEGNSSQYWKQINESRTQTLPLFEPPHRLYLTRYNNFVCYKCYAFHCFVQSSNCESRVTSACMRVCVRACVRAYVRACVRTCVRVFSCIGPL